MTAGDAPPRGRKGSASKPLPGTPYWGPDLIPGRVRSPVRGLSVVAADARLARGHWPNRGVLAELPAEHRRVPVLPYLRPAGRCHLRIRVVKGKRRNGIQGVAHGLSPLHPAGSTIFHGFRNHSRVSGPVLQITHPGLRSGIEPVRVKGGVLRRRKAYRVQRQGGAHRDRESQALPMGCSQCLVAGQGIVVVVHVHELGRRIAGTNRRGQRGVPGRFIQLDAFPCEAWALALGATAKSKLLYICTPSMYGSNCTAQLQSVPHAIAPVLALRLPAMQPDGNFFMDSWYNAEADTNLLQVIQAGPFLAASPN